MRIGKWSAGALVMLVAAANAADSSMEAARRCTQVQDSLQRLVCFDKAFAEAPAAAPQPAPRAAARPTAPPAAASAAAAAAVAAPVADAAPSIAPAKAEQEFGGERLKSTKEARKQDAGPSQISAKVTALKEMRRGVWRFTLENEQIWQQEESDQYLYPKVGDTVEIDRGMLGGYHLEVAGGSRRVRVTRLK